MKLKKIVSTFALMVVPFFVSICQAQLVINGAQEVQFGSSLTLPPGSQLYIYGMKGGGCCATSPFLDGQSISVTNAAGVVAAELAVSTVSSNSFTTDDAYYVIGGFGASSYKYVQAFYGANPGPAIGTQTAFSMTGEVSFVLSAPATVVVVAMGDVAQTVSGLPGLINDAPSPNSQGYVAFEIDHAKLWPGAYRARVVTGPDGASQIVNEQVALIGAFIFSDEPNAATSSDSQIPLPTPPFNTHGCGGIPYGLVAYYPFDGNADDASGNGNNGSVVGATFLPGPNNKLALACNGTASTYVVVPESSSLEPTNGISISFWCNGVPGSIGYGTILRKSDNCSPGYYIRANDNSGTNNTPTFRIDPPNPCGPLISPFVPFLPCTGTNWQHFVATYSDVDGLMKTYANGVLANQIPYSNQLQNSGDLYIGGATVHPQDGGFNGLINEVRIYNRELSPEEVQRLFLGLCPNTPLGEIANACGCTIDDLVPCNGPRTGGIWRNHSEYVLQVIRTATKFLEEDLITPAEWADSVTKAARSKCGWNPSCDRYWDWDWNRNWDWNRDQSWSGHY